MLLEKAIEAVLSGLAEAGLKEGTIAHNYECFYHALVKGKPYDKELNVQLVFSFLLSRYGRNLMDIPYCQLSKQEQICAHAFRILFTFQESLKLPVRYRKRNSPLKADLEVLDDYVNFRSDSGDNPRTLKRKRESIQRFLSLNTLQSFCLADITTYVQLFKGSSAYYQKRELDEVKKFLQYCREHNYINQDVHKGFPNIKATKGGRIPSVFTVDEIKVLLAYFAARDSVNRLRDYTLVLLMAVYGLRSIDISCLKCSCLDFENETIYFQQSKTGIMVNHRILPHIGNILVDYILNERPQSNTEFLFLKHDGSNLSPKSIGSIVRNGFLSSGIDIGRRRYGSHALRHSLASSLINDGTSIFTIANVLGQTSAETARLYAKVDVSHLSLCALEVPNHE
jgi:site-specific recombinase XerD